MNRLELLVLKSPPLRAVRRVSRRIVLPGFEGLTLFEVGTFFFSEIRNYKLNERSAAVTYNFLMAIPPTLLFLFSLVPYLPLGDVQNTILNTLSLVVTNENLYHSLEKLVQDFMNRERRDILSFGILLTLFFSSNGMMGLMRSFDRSIHVYVKRNGFQRRWVSVKLTFMLLCVAVISLGLFIIQTNAVNELLERMFNGVIAIKIFSSLIIVTIIFCSISIIYTYGPSLTHRFKFISPGSIFATVASVITTVIFFFLVNNFLNYNKVYGSIGTLIAFMVWIWLNTLIILIGYELNVSILLGKTSHGPIPLNSQKTQ
jgi:membrane protein